MSEPPPPHAPLDPPPSQDALFALLYEELRGTAQRLVGRGADLRATELVHEAWLKLVPGHAHRFEPRRALAVALTKTMRSILVDRAREQSRLKRGGDRRREPLDDVLAVYDSAGTDLLDLDAALLELAKLDAELAELAELHVVGGLSLVEIAELRGDPERSLAREWEAARRWLARRMQRGGFA